MRVNVASGGTDMKAINALIRVGNKRSVLSPQPTAKVSPQGSKSPSEPTVSVPMPEVKKNPVELVSAKGIDYHLLEYLLKEQEWLKADELTAKLMCQVAGREKECWLREEDINQFPCEDLRTIDQLWVHYSNSKFGFSIQKKLWLECGGEIGKYDYEVWKKFGTKVNWYNSQCHGWREYDTLRLYEILFDQTPVLASLPSVMLPHENHYGGRRRIYREGGFSYLASRLVRCSR